MRRLIQSPLKRSGDKGSVIGFCGGGWHSHCVRDDEPGRVCPQVFMYFLHYQQKLIFFLLESRKHIKLLLDSLRG